MTRRDFKAFARMIASLPTWFDGMTSDADVRDRLAREMADVLEQGTVRFDRARFLRACGSGGDDNGA